jgi:hypothetical protein
MVPSDANTPMPPATAPATCGSQLQTTAKTLFAPSKMLEEHIAGMGTRTDITIIISARKQLSTNGMIVSTAGSTVKHLIGAIFEMSLVPTLRTTHSESLRAIAIIDRLDALLEGMVVTLNKNIDSFASLTSKQAATLQKTTLKVSKQLENSTAELGKAVEHTTHTPGNMQMNAQNSSGSQGSQSYASVTKTGIPPPLTKLLSHSEAQACQILIEKRSLQATNELKELTEVQLTTKAELTLKLMSKAGTTLPDNISFLSAKKVQNSEILYELNAPANRSKFLNHFGTDIIIKEQVYQVLLENIPISFNPNSKIALSEIECKEV